MQEGHNMLRYGALPEEWQHFSITLGLTADLLPVVSNPTRNISPGSTITELGKVPSVLNYQGDVVGILDWPNKSTKPAAIVKWAGEPDYGICVQTRRVRAFDIDDPDKAVAIVEVIEGIAGTLPKRIRKNSGKCLLMFKLAGRESKRVIPTGEKEGKKTAIEFLANGQQFVACGTHPSGARIEWEGGMPLTIPELTLEQVDRIWAELEKRFGVSPSTKNKASDRDATLNEALRSDPVAVALKDGGHVISIERDGRMHITCPWAEEHSTESSDSATTYFPAHTGGYESGNFVCKHAHCADRTIDDLRRFLGFDSAESDFSVPPEDAYSSDGIDEYLVSLESAIDDFDEMPHVVERWIPCGEITLLAGHGGCGKSFVALSLAIHVVLGRPFGGLAVQQSKVLFISAEDTGKVCRRRIAALCGSLKIDRGLLVGKLHVADLSKIDSALFREGNRRRAAATDLLEKVAVTAKRLEAKLIVLDNASEVFDADEIRRQHVRGFVRALRTHLATPDTGVLLLAHVNRQTASLGHAADAEAYSGSTAWHNSVRSRLALVPGKDDRFSVAHGKANFGPRAKPVSFEWREGVPLVIEQVDQSCRDAVVDRDAIIAVMRDFAARGERIPTTVFGPYSAYRVLSTAQGYPPMLDANGLTQLLRAMESEGVLVRETVTTPNRKKRECFFLKDGI